MSTICVDFEVLPAHDDSGISAQQVYDNLQQQLKQKDSPLMIGNYGWTPVKLDVGDTAALGPPHMEDAPMPPPLPQIGQPSEGMFPSAGGGPGSGHSWAPQGSQPHYDAIGPPPATSDWQAAHYDGARSLSNAELVDRVSQLERQLVHTASGSHVPQDHDTLPRRSVEVEALSEKCQHLTQRLEVMEPELRQAREAERSWRAKAEQAELRLKDREQLLSHAKEMWMKENVRASRLADQLTSAEDQLADQERRLKETMESYQRAQQEVRQLQHLLGGPVNGHGVPNGGFGGVDAGQQHFDTWGEDPTQRPATSRNLAEAGRISQFGDTPLEADTNADRFRRLSQLNDAILYEDELIQIGVKMEFIGREGQIAVFFGNKGSAALQAFTVQYFVREDHALRLSAAPISQQLDADAQVIQRVNAQFLEPFVEPPWLRIQFLLPDASPRRIQTRFPVMITKFMQGLELSSSEFFRLWRQQHFVLNEVTSIVHLAARFSGPLVHVARNLVFGGALRLHHGIDTEPENFVLVSRLASGQDHDRDRDRGGLGDDADSGLSLVRVEVGKDRFAGKARVVVRSSNHATAKAICDSIVGQLSEVSKQH